MTQKIKLAMLAMLGFSTACSTVKKAPKAADKQTQDTVQLPRIVVMYGVRPPQGVTVIQDKEESSLEPVMEQPDDKDVPQVQKKETPKPAEQ